MADAELNPQQPEKLQRFMIPLIVFLSVIGVLGLFTIAYLTLSTPMPPPEDIDTILGKAKAEANEKIAMDQDSEEVATDQSMDSTGGQFDFDRHRYYSFPPICQ